MSGDTWVQGIYYNRLDLSYTGHSEVWISVLRLLLQKKQILMVGQHAAKVKVNIT